MDRRQRPADRQPTANAKPGEIETEFGTPIPGRILPPEQWAKTALKKLPEGVWDWEAIFGRPGLVVIDVGCGNGRSVLESALRRPDVNHLGIDILPVVIRYATRRGNQRGLHGVRFAVIGGRELLERHVAPGSVSEIHVYHPQPYYTDAEKPKRLISPAFLELVHRSLQPGGKLVLQTDHPAYWEAIRATVPSLFDWQELPEGWPESPGGRTRRELIARGKRLPVFRGIGTRKDLPAAEVAELVKSLPFPMFTADRRLRELDRLEAGAGASRGSSRRPKRR